MSGRAGRPLVLLDLAVPRDVDPAAGALPGVTLYDLDSLEVVAAANRRQRAAEIAGAETSDEDREKIDIARGLKEPRSADAEAEVEAEE